MSKCKLSDSDFMLVKSAIERNGCKDTICDAPKEEAEREFHIKTKGIVEANIASHCIWSVLPSAEIERGINTVYFRCSNCEYAQILRLFSQKSEEWSRVSDLAFKMFLSKILSG